MGIKAKAIRKLKHNRKSLGLTRRIKSYSIKSFKLNKKVEHNIEVIKEILGRRNVEEITNMLKSTSKSLGSLATMTYREFVYYGTIHKRLIDTLKTIVKDLRKVEKEIGDSSDESVKRITIGQEIKIIEDIMTGFSNKMRIEVNTVRDFKREHETSREGLSALTGEKGLFHKIKNNTKKLRKDLKMEKVVKSKLKHLPQKIRKILKSKSKNKAKEITNHFEILHKEYNIMNDEVGLLLYSVKLNIRTYFEVIDTIKKFKTEYEWIKKPEHPEPFPEKELKEINKECKQLIDTVSDHEKAELLIERFLFGKVKSAQRETRKL